MSLGVPAPEQQAGQMPLAGLRVVDLADGKAEMCGRLLADLGADVIRVEPPGGAASRRQQPLHDGVSLHFATHNANKRGVTLDLDDPEDRKRLLALAEDADILIETEAPGTLERVGLGADALLERNPALVAVSITEFGQTGPYRDWVGSNWTQIAIGGALSRSGMPGRQPVQPPGALAHESAAVQAAFAALLAYINRLDTGRGDHVDCSIYEITTQILDPGLGIGGSAVGGLSSLEMGRDRPNMDYLYPIFPCADGFIRVAILARRQWRAMFEWMGEPDEFADPSYDRVPARRDAHARLRVYMAEHFKDKPMAELMARGQKLGIPIEALRGPGEALRAEHFLESGIFIDVEVAPGLTGRVPSGFLVVDGVRVGIRQRAPEVGEHNAEVFSEPRRPRSGPRPRVAGSGRRRPLEGVRVLDLGIIVVGAEAGRLLADAGAEVIKVESFEFADAGRPPEADVIMNTSFAAGHRNKIDAGINLRTPEGVDCFKQLAAVSDVVLSNFKPGTMDRLGVGADAIHEVNPGAIVVESSSFGPTGPWSRRGGYGPLVRAAIGLTELWRDVTVDNGFCDTITIYPDHVGGRISAIAVLASLIERRRTGKGRTVTVAQADIVLTQLSTEYLRESLEPGSLVALGNSGEWDAPQGVYPCAGDDEWCAITVDGDAQWCGLCEVIDRRDLLADERLATAAGRVAHRELIDQAVTDWTRGVEPREATARLQAGRVPAGFMQRILDLFEDPQLAAREAIREMPHPHLEKPTYVENSLAKFRHIADPELRPAPIVGEHTEEIVSRVLGMDDARIRELIDAGALQDASVNVR